MEKPATAQALAASIVGMTALSAGDLITALHRLPAQSASTGADFVLANSFYRFQLLRAQALVRSGDVEAADAALRTARQYRHPAYVYVESTGLLAEAWVAAARERSSDARQLAWRAAEFTRNHGQLAREVLCLQTAVQFGDTSATERLAELATLVRGAESPAGSALCQRIGVRRCLRYWSRCPPISSRWATCSPLPMPPVNRRCRIVAQVDAGAP